MYDWRRELASLELANRLLQRPPWPRRCLAAERGEIDLLTTAADQYDLVCNGVELSSGANRNHDPEIMIKRLELVRLGEEDEGQVPAMYNASSATARPRIAGIASWRRPQWSAQRPGQ